MLWVLFLWAHGRGGSCPFWNTMLCPVEGGACRLALKVEPGDVDLTEWADTGTCCFLPGQLCAPPCLLSECWCLTLPKAVVMPDAGCFWMRMAASLESVAVGSASFFVLEVCSPSSVPEPGSRVHPLTSCVRWLLTGDVFHMLCYQPRHEEDLDSRTHEFIPQWENTSSRIMVIEKNWQHLMLARMGNHWISVVLLVGV